MLRREFLKDAAIAGAAAAILPRRLRAAGGADSRIEILVDEPMATISPNIYGHFVEHLGGVIYDGVWVGEGSKIPNTGGVRTALVDRLKAIKCPVIRWPGGCFADSYDWKDGIGSRAKRPRRTNFWVDDHDAQRLNGKGVQLYENNAFGTDEFMRFCKLAGSQPYLASNLRSLPALEFDHWVEYCNSPAGSTTFAEARAAGGSAQPYNVEYWGVGNESWGCGGNFAPEEYASEYRRFTTWVPSYGVPLKFIGSGPNDAEIDWTRRFFDTLFHSRQYYDLKSVWGWSVHHYAVDLSRGKPHTWVNEKGDALQFDLVDYYEVLRQADSMEAVIHDHWTALGEFDLEHRIKLVIDEYGPWYRQGTELDNSHIFGQQITMRDAMATALSLDTFNRNPEKVGMAACAQLINCINALFFSHEDKFIVTPNFHVFDMYAAHQGAQAIRAEFSAPAVSYSRDNKAASFWGLKGSASLTGKTLNLTVVNPHATESRETEIAVRGGSAASSSATVLASSDMHAHNSFEQPDAVKTSKAAVGGTGSLLHFTFPPASVSKISVSLT